MVLMTFGQALHEMKLGAKCARIAWHGKDMWVAAMPPLFLTAEKVNKRTKRFIGEDAELDCQAYLAIRTEEGKWQPGWVPSQEDMFANDWWVVEQESEE